MRDKIEQYINESIEVKKKILEDSNIIETIKKVVDYIVDVYKNNGKILLCGNGGSAADAQHIAAEFSGRFKLDRRPLFAEALHVNTSYLTAVANDYSYDEVFSRLVEAFGKSGDFLIAISTSGNSPNILKAIEKARELGIKVLGLSGKDGGKMKDMCDYIIVVPSYNTPRIQEAHIMIGHIIAELVENNLFGGD